MTANIRHVPGAYPTIQSALMSCQSNDTVLVQAGNYPENLSWPAVNGIKLLSVSGPDSTVLSGNQSGRVLAISSALLDTTTHITGFTFRDGYLDSGQGYGAGIYITNAAVILNDIRVTGNRVFLPGGHGYGAGIYLDNSSTIIVNSTINENSIDSASWCYGAGIYISGGSPVISNVNILNNSARSDSWCYGVGLFARANAMVRVEQTTVSGNYSGNNALWYYGNGIFLGNVTATLTNVLVTNNTSGSGGTFNYGGGIFCDGTNGNINLVNVTVAENYRSGNGAITGSGIYVRDAFVIAINSIFYNFNSEPEGVNSLNGTLDILFSNVRGGYAGLGNQNVVPGFASSTDFHLLSSSLCAGAATDNGAPLVDRDGIPRPLPASTMPDQGCYEVDQSATTVLSPQANENTFNIYPNPVIAGTPVFITHTSGTLVITDCNGKKISETTGNEGLTAISTNGLKPGMYLVHSGSHKGRLLQVIGKP
ncbi:MAG: T9SS type A sorting domain-containing protein [Bacteroidota bacterium]|nr:T9SS type A sorting domain-containing protein [Bacteroidota bacterium]